MPLRPLDRVGADLAEWASSQDARVPTGYGFFDERTSGGIATGELLVLICYSGVGKTWFGVNVAQNNPDVPAVMFSLEMHGRYILQRMSASHSQVSTSNIESTLKRGNPSPAVQHTIEDYPLFMIEDDPDMGFGDMLDTLDEYEAEIGMRPKLVIVDYLELVKSFADSGSEHVDGLARQAKKFARTADVALIVLHQVKKSEVKVQFTDAKGNDKFRNVPNVGQAALTVHDARFGGNTQADYVLGMYRPSMDPELTAADADFIEHDLRLQLLKTRADGGTVPQGVQHHWNSTTGRISELRGASGDRLIYDGVIPLHPEVVARG